MLAFGGPVNYCYICNIPNYTQWSYLTEEDMFQEIERKFLVKGDFKSYSHCCRRIVQGYMCSDSVRTVRVRIYGDKGYIAVKGRNHVGGLARFEWEKEIWDSFIATLDDFKIVVLPFDCLHWTKSSSGCFLVKDMYNLCSASGPAESFWSKVWEKVKLVLISIIIF